MTPLHMKIKTSELTGAALDWVVSTLESKYSMSLDTDIDGTKRVNVGGMYPEWSTDWAQGGPIIEREHIELLWSGQDWTAVTRADKEFFGFTPLIAAMRCFVSSRYGDEVEIPEELLT